MYTNFVRITKFVVDCLRESNRLLIWTLFIALLQRTFVDRYVISKIGNRSTYLPIGLTTLTFTGYEFHPKSMDFDTLGSKWGYAAQASRLPAIYANGFLSLQYRSSQKSEESRKSWNLTVAAPSPIKESYNWSKYHSFPRWNVLVACRLCYIFTVIITIEVIDLGEERTMCFWRILLRLPPSSPSWSLFPKPIGWNFPTPCCIYMVQSFCLYYDQSLNQHNEFTFYLHIYHALHLRRTCVVQVKEVKRGDSSRTTIASTSISNFAYSVSWFVGASLYSRKLTNTPSSTRTR